MSNFFFEPGDLLRLYSAWKIQILVTIGPKMHPVEWLACVRSNLKMTLYPHPHITFFLNFSCWISKTIYWPWTTFLFHAIIFKIVFVIAVLLTLGMIILEKCFSTVTSPLSVLIVGKLILNQVIYLDINYPTWWHLQ